MSEAANARVDGDKGVEDVGHHRAGGGGVVPAAGPAGRNGNARAVTPIPASIVAAICQIKASMEAVKKSQRNQHGGYNFASTDDIYAVLTRKMGEVGLVVLSLEDRCEIKRIEKTGKNGEPVISQWAHMEYSFVLATAEATWTDERARRSLFIQVTGPQTFQAAQSFVEKSFFRSLFKIPSGDMDLGAMPQGDTEEDQIALSRNGRVPRKSSAEGKRDGSVRTFNEIRGAIQAAISAEHLRHIRTTYADEWAEMPPRWATTLDEEYETRMSDFGVQQAAE